MHPSLDEVIFTWGKYKGQTLGSVRKSVPQYLQWLSMSSTLPANWVEAAKRALVGGDVSDLSLPRIKHTTPVQQTIQNTNQKIAVDLSEKSTATIVMPYDKVLMEQFKFEIDGRKWNAEEKHWEFPAVHLPKIKKIFPQAIFSDKATAALSKLIERREHLDEIRELEDTDFEIPGLKLKLFPYQKIGVKFVDRAGGRALIADAPGLGKAQPVDADVLTPTGWKMIGNLNVGDLVITPDNKTATIVGIFPQGKKDIYKVWFNDGSYVESCLEHLWMVSTKDYFRGNNKWKIKSLNEIKNDLYFTNTTRCKWFIPQVSPIELPQYKKLPIHPYLLGVLLGDGNLTTGRIKLTSKDPEIIKFIEENCLSNTMKITQSTVRDIEYTLVRNDKKPFINEIKLELSKLEMMGKYAHEKTIPSVYMNASLTNRIDLFNGLMDTDGWCSTNKALQYGSTSKTMAFQVKELVESFGGTARVSIKNPSYKGKIYRPFYILTIALPVQIIPFKLTRKLSAYTSRTKYIPKRFITKIEFSRNVDAKCISLDENGPLYITNNYTVTHNTAQAIAYAQLHNLKTLIVCPLSVVVNWQREIKKFTGKESTIWDSKSYAGSLGNNFHITHFDAVGKNNQWLRDQKFDLLVCDEATYLKNRQTIRAKSILGSWKERRKYPGIKTKYVIFLTGTPVMSRPVEAFALLNFLDKERFNNFYHFVQRYGGWRGQAPMNLQDLHDRTKDLVIRRKKEQVFKEMPLKQRNDLYVELSKDEKKEYNELLKEMFGKWKMDGKPSVQHMPKLQGFLIEKKLPRLIEIIDEFIDNNRSILIFSCYISPLKKLHEHYGDKSALLTGEMNKTERQKSIDSLVNKTANVGLFSLRAAGMGIDGLQHVMDTVIFTDMGWLPAEHEQAEDRTHRIGQKNQVQAYYMICEGTIDEYMRDILKEKQEIADIIVDGALLTPDRNKSMFKEFVKRINSAYSQRFVEENLED